MSPAPAQPRYWLICATCGPTPAPTADTTCTVCGATSHHLSATYPLRSLL